MIPPGQKWDEVIERQLNDSRSVVVLWSTDSVCSDWVKTEAAEAVRRGILVPLLIEPVQIPLEFRRVQTLDLSDWDLRRDTPGVDLLRAAIGGLTARQPTMARKATTKARTCLSAKVWVALVVPALFAVALAIYFSDVWRGSAAELAARSESLREEVLRKFDEDTTSWPQFLEERGRVPLEQAMLLSIESLLRGGGEPAAAGLRKAAVVMPRPVREFAHKTKVTAVAVSADGKLLATGSEGDGTGVWELDSGRVVARLPTADKINDLTFSHDGKRLATAGRDGVVRLWGTSAGERLASMSHPAAGDFGVHRILMTPDGNRLVSLENRTAHVWSLPEGREVLTLEHGHHLAGAKLSRDGRYLVCWGSQMVNAPVSVWELQSGKLSASLDRGQSGITSVAVGSSLVAVARPDQISFWKFGEWSRAATLRAKLTPSSIALGPNDVLLAIGGGYARYGALALADVASPEPVPRILSQTKNAGIYFVGFSSDGSKVVGVGQDQSAQVLGTQTGVELVRARTGSDMHLARSPVAFSADGRYLATAGANRARLWDTTPVRTAAQGCALVGRNFSRPEWRAFFGDEPYRQTCTSGAAEQRSR
jgi:hypothetical protein